MDSQIGRVQKHNLRTLWKNEERDFTRWLSANVELLGSELELEIDSKDANGENPAEVTVWAGDRLLAFEPSDERTLQVDLSE